MDPTGIGLFQLAENRLRWIDQRQSVLAQNIANIDTPGYQPRDIQPFAAQLAAATTSIVRTDARHMEGTHDVSSGIAAQVTEKAPDGNAVSLQEQLTKVADTETTQQLVTNLYSSYMGMFRTVLGKES
jgi:flagellar basal-body rod protein FlgB